MAPTSTNSTSPNTTPLQKILPKQKNLHTKPMSCLKAFAPKDMLLCLKQLAKVEPKNALKYSQDYIRISDSMQQLERE
jgi:hypothetical protein